LLRLRSSVCELEARRRNTAYDYSHELNFRQEYSTSRDRYIYISYGNLRANPKIGVFHNYVLEAGVESIRQIESRTIRGSMKATKPLTINSIDVDNDEELDALMAEVLAEGDKIYEAQYQEALRLGIVDEKGRLLKHELPEDMREGAGTDFGE
jgi:hypothetical protein